MTQKERVLRHLQDYGSITSMEAFSEYGITRLSAVIFDLRSQGHSIETINETGEKRYEEKTTYARYILERKPTQLELGV